MTREILKLIAMIAMAFDHTALVGLAGDNWLLFSCIGRLAFPIFAYQLATGFLRTSSKKNYLRNLGLFALISEIPFNLVHGSVVYPFAQNVMISFFIALLALFTIEKFCPSPWNTPFKVIKNVIVCLAVTSVAYLLGFVGFVDYFGMGILLVILYYFILRLPKTPWMVYLQIPLLTAVTVYFNDSLGGMFFVVAGTEIQMQMLSTFSLLPIALYILMGEKKVLSGARDRAFKYFCYAFYPLHLTILYLVASASL